MKLPADALSPRVVRLVGALALAAAVAVAVALPATYFVAGYLGTRGVLEGRALLGSAVVSAFIMRQPEFWQHEDGRIRGQLAQFAAAEEAETWRVRDSEGHLVAERSMALPWPVLTVAEPVYDAGVDVGRVETERSIQALALRTAGVALLAIILAGICFVVLRLLPLRLLALAVRRAAHLATHDPLTGLPNRALFRDRLERALARSRRDGTTVAVLLLDLDRFKEINDTLGHAAGDELLRQVARRATACLRESDTFARLGGDEFAIVQIGAHHPTDAETLARRLLAALSEPYDLAGQRASVGVSIGITLRSGQAPGPPEDLSPDALLHEADVALYRCKAEGRQTHRFFQHEMGEAMKRRRALETDLREALATGQFRLHFQPQVCIGRRDILGAEALVRWHHPVRGVLLPDAFIPLAEETGLIEELGEQVLREACREAAGWPPDLRIAVNVSPAQFHRPGFVAMVERVLRETGLLPRRLELEVTEGILLSDTAQTVSTLRELHGLGVKIAMDDFGTGYSSLAYLQKFAFDKLKIDRTFVRSLIQDPQSVAIVAAVLQMGHALGMEVIAEGVENEEQAALLRVHGCDEMQGYLVSQAVPAAEFQALVAAVGEPAAALPWPPPGGGAAWIRSLQGGDQARKEAEPETPRRRA